MQVAELNFFFLKYLIFFLYPVMGSIDGKWDDDEYSVIGDKGEVGFIDYQEDKSVCSYNPNEEGPIVISVPFPFIDGKPRSVFLGETVADSITIKNTTTEAVDLWTKIYASNPENSFTLSLMEPPSANGGNDGQGFLESYALEDRMLQPGDTLTVWLNCRPKEIGLYTSIVHFDVGIDSIERVVFLLAEDNISRSLASKKAIFKNYKKEAIYCGYICWWFTTCQTQGPGIEEKASSL